MSSIVIYPGTFDPITLGHMDIIKRASCLFGKVIVAVAANAQKSPLFSLAERIFLIETVTTEQQNVTVKAFTGLLVDFAACHNADIILRGLRAVSDFEFEMQLAGMNRRMLPTIETLFMTPAEEFTFLSATIVREIAKLGGDVGQFVHPEVKNALCTKFRK